MSRLASLFLLAALSTIAACPVMAMSRESVNAQAARELHAQNSKAESCFVAAVAAENRGDFKTAVSLYHRVGTLVPGHVHSLRREGGLLMVLGQHAKGLELIQQAAARQRTPENLAALAWALSWHREGVQPTPEDLENADRNAREAFQLEPDDPDNARLVCEIALQRNDLEEFRLGVAALERSAPESLSTHFLAYIEHNAMDEPKE